MKIESYCSVVVNLDPLFQHFLYIDLLTQILTLLLRLKSNNLFLLTSALIINIKTKSIYSHYTNRK